MTNIKNNFNRLSILAQMAGVAILILCLFLKHPLLLTVLFPLGGFLVFAGFIIWIIYVLRLERKI